MNRIRELRSSKGMSQVRLSTELEVEQTTISGYEKGKSYPSVDILTKMSKLFNASCDYILGISDVKTIHRGGEYNEDEIILISEYRTLAPSERKMIKAYMQGVIDEKENIRSNQQLK